MYATRNPEGAIQVPRAARSIQFGLTAGWLMVGLAVASLLVGLIWSDGLMRYPEAQHIGKAHLRLDTLAKGYIIQYGTYRTADDLPQVADVDGLGFSRYT